MRLTLRHGYLPADLDDLLFVAPLRVDAKTIYNAGGGVDAMAPATQVVDANGTYIDPDTGLITDAQANVLRIGGGIDLASKDKGALFEGLVENKLLDSRNFDPATTSWSIQGGTPIVNSNVAAGIDGTLAADELKEDESGSIASISQLVTGIPDDSTWWTFSAHIRKDSDESRFPEINLDLGGGTVQNIRVQLNTKTGAIVERSPTGIVNYYVLDKGTYWKIVVSVKNNGTGNVAASVAVYPAIASTFGETQASAIGSIIIDAAKLENLPFATTFIETTGAPKTRAADDIRFDNTSEVNLKAASGTIYIALTPEYDAADLVEVATLIDFRATSPENGIVFYVQPGGAFRLLAYSDDSITGFVAGTTIPVRGSTYVVAFVWDTNDFRLYVNGISEGTEDTSGAAPTAVGTLWLGANRETATNLQMGQLSHLHIYDSAHDAARILANTKEIQSWLGI